ncbi:hypothetical protein JHK85_023162 [Glycine max]|uniref:Uncharacterized protein n=1 Tax=Glycine max TaxID=3847 RepID=A0A0R0IT17_SOYBN|nr:hypothetical protein JHK85_023162 [Glycine max]KAH1053313.1 hypothetical protein GYH30_022552 [Glycine max]
MLMSARERARSEERLGWTRISFKARENVNKGSKAFGWKARQRRGKLELWNCRYNDTLSFIQVDVCDYMPISIDEPVGLAILWSLCNGMRPYLIYLTLMQFNISVVNYKIF